MDHDTWQTVERVFYQALEVAEDQRLELIRRLAGGNSTIADEVISLLKNHREDASDLDHPSGEPIRQAVNQAMQLLEEMESPEGKTIESDKGEDGLQAGNSSSNDDVDVEKIRQRVESLSSDYEFQSIIGRGGMGLVVRVLDKTLNRQVAMKLILDADSHPTRRNRFLKESRALAKLASDHIVDIYRVSDGQAPYILMEWIRGPSLRSIIVRRRRLPPRFAAEVVRQATLGLQDAHRVGLIHRDIKPGNILLQRKSSNQRPWRAKLVDFGLARSDESEQTLEESLIGTPAYMSPEQLHYQGKVDRRSDIYAMGITLYEVLVGEPPFRGAPHMILRQIERQDPRPPRELDDRIPKDLESICLKAISKDPQSRYQTATSLAEDLGRFLHGQPTLARPVTQLDQWYRWAKRNRRLAAALGAVACLTILIAIGSLIAAGVFWQKNRLIATQQNRMNRALCERIATADADSLPLCIEQIRTQVDNPISLLHELEAHHQDQRARFNIAISLTALGESKLTEIIARVGSVKTTPGQCRSIAMALEKFPAESKQLLHDRFNSVTSDLEKVKLSVLAMEIDDLSLVDRLLDFTQSPELRTKWVHTLPQWHSHLETLIEHIHSQNSVNLVSALCLGIGLMEPQTFSPDLARQLRHQIDNLLSHSDNSGVLGAARWLIQQPVAQSVAGHLASDPQAASETSAPPSTFSDPTFNIRWVRVRAGEFQMGNGDPTLQYAGRSLHPVQLTKDFWIADREVEVALYRKFLLDPHYAEDQKPNGWKQWQADDIISPTDRHPVQQVSWLDAVLFCNWLSQRQQLMPVYTFQKTIKLTDNNGKELEIETWERSMTANGYRLPTEAEFELACRAGTATNYSFGNDRHFLEYYGAWSNNTRVPAQPCGTMMPNPLGIFDMHGNVWEWTEDWYRDYPSSKEIDPRGVEPVTNGRTFRGGGVCTFSGDPVSCSRGSARPDVRYQNLGFRLARNVD
jgi:formylglycine-generating enzyme required for sulfatase activity